MNDISKFDKSLQDGPKYLMHIPPADSTTSIQIVKQ